MSKCNVTWLAALAIWAISHTALAVEVVLSCGATGTEFKQCQLTAQAWSKKTGNTVKIVSAPNNVSERLGLYQMLLAAKSSDIDVFPMDVIWPGIIGTHFLDLRDYTTPEILSQHFAAYIENNTVDGRLVAIPNFIDAGLLFYRKDLLEKYSAKVPTTWQELHETAEKIQLAENKTRDNHNKLWGYIFEGRAYEGLTCNANEWFASFGAGTLVDINGNVTVNNPNAAAALRTVRSWIGTISPEGVLNYSEEEARGLFQSGQAVFMRNWPYAWPLAQSKDSVIRGKIGLAVLPHGPNGTSAGTLGGWSYAVSRYSQHPKEAAELVMFMTSRSEQKRRAIEGAFNPTLPQLYEDPDVIRAQPFMKDLFDVFKNAVARPARLTRTQYNRVSAEFWDTTHLVISGQQQPEPALADLEKKLKRISRNGRW